MKLKLINLLILIFDNFYMIILICIIKIIFNRNSIIKNTIDFFENNK